MSIAHDRTDEPSDPVVPPNNGTNDRREVAACAANFGNKYSIASGISALAGISKDNPFLSTAFGNDASSISNIASGRNRLGTTISEIFSNPGSKNVCSFAVRGVGAIPTGGAQTAELGVNGTGSYFVKAWSTPTLAGTVVGKTAGATLSAFTKYKAIYDFSAHGIGPYPLLVSTEPSRGGIVRAIGGAVSAFIVMALLYEPTVRLAVPKALFFTAIGSTRADSETVLRTGIEVTRHPFQRFRKLS